MNGSVYACVDKTSSIMVPDDANIGGNPNVSLWNVSSLGYLRASAR